MKTLLSLIVVLFSANVLSHTCHISIYDPYNRPYLNFHTERDLNCQAAARSCYSAISQYRLNPYQYKCYTISMTPDAVVEGLNDQEHRRDLKLGETVIYQRKIWVVSFIQDNGQYELIPESGKKKDIEKNVARKDIALTRGCLRDICTKTSFISKTSQSYVSVEGIDYNGGYIVQDIGSKELTEQVEFYNLVKTSGCVQGNEEICAGNTVLARTSNYYNRYYEVVGIQSDRLLVLKDQEGKLYFNVDPRLTQITR